MDGAISFAPNSTWWMPWEGKLSCYWRAVPSLGLLSYSVLCPINNVGRARIAKTLEQQHFPERDLGNVGWSRHLGAELLGHGSTILPRWDSLPSKTASVVRWAGKCSYTFPLGYPQCPFTTGRNLRVPVTREPGELWLVLIFPNLWLQNPFDVGNTVIF